MEEHPGGAPVSRARKRSSGSFVLLNPDDEKGYAVRLGERSPFLLLPYEGLYIPLSCQIMLGAEAADDASSQRVPGSISCEPSRVLEDLVLLLAFAPDGLQRRAPHSARAFLVDSSRVIVGG